MKKELEKFKAFQEQLRNAPVEPEADKIKRSENIPDFVEWFKYYFPEFNSDGVKPIFMEQHLKALDKKVSSVVLPNSKSRSGVIYLDMERNQDLDFIYDTLNNANRWYQYGMNNVLVKKIIEAFNHHGYDVTDQNDLIKLKDRCQIMKVGKTSTLVIDYKTNPVNICCFTDYELHQSMPDGVFTLKAEMKFKIL